MAEGASPRNTQDKLNVFVSSRLTECADERGAARRAIAALKQNPILFEHLGARAYGARDVYLSRLRASQLVVAIYKDGYGYIDSANGMSISGLEDEVRSAFRLGIAMLAYVHSDGASREVRLTQLIGKLQERLKTSAYNDLGELEEQIKTDVASTMTDMIMSAQSRSKPVEKDAGALLGRTVAWSGTLQQREALLAEIDGADTGIVCLYGESGAGKTTLAALYSKRTDSFFLRVTGLSPKDILSACANLIASSRDDLVVHASMESALRDFGSSWAGADSITLVVDECSDPESLMLHVKLAGGTSATKRLIFTSAAKVIGATNILVPPLQEGGEVLDAASAVAEVAIADRVSGVGGPETIAVSSQAGRELLNYLALSPRPLSSEALAELRSEATYGPAQVSDDLGRERQFVDETPQGFKLIHERIAQRILDQLRKLPQRLSFYAGRLSRHFERNGDIRSAYSSALKAENGSEETFALSALRQAARDGDWRQGVEIANRLLARAQANERVEDAFRLSLQLVTPLELTGDAQGANQILEAAKRLAEGLGQEAKEQLFEVELSLRARSELSQESISALVDLYGRYGQEDRAWDQARIALELSAIFIGAKDDERAAKYARTALSLFEQVGDEAGKEYAKRNLISALISRDSVDPEAEALMAELREEKNPQHDNRRERAWELNLRVRQLRKAGRYGEAVDYARQAIALGEELGDEYVKAINSINLGNALSDLKDTDSALNAYSGAGIAAQKCRRRDIESDASRLSAEVLNDLLDASKLDKTDFATRSRNFAEHALGLLSESAHLYGRARAFVELGRALAHLGEEFAAGEEFFNAASEARTGGRDELFGRALDFGMSYTFDDPEKYAKGLARALGLSFLDSEPLSARLIAIWPQLALVVPMQELIHLLGLHLKVVFDYLPEPFHGALAVKLVATMIEMARGSEITSYRLLQAAVPMAAALSRTGSRFAFSELARAICAADSSVYCRNEDDGAQVWTLSMNWGKPVIISIASLDSSLASQVACLALAGFLKAFETEIAAELPIQSPASTELTISVVAFDEMPADLQNLLSAQGVQENLTRGGCSVTRPTDFDSNLPTNVVVGPEFLNLISMGVPPGGSFQMLFGLTTIEIVYQLLRGEVDLDAIRPKVVSIVGKTL